MDWLKLIHGDTKRTAPATFGTGDDVRVWYRILEQGKERFGQFEGTVIRARGSGRSSTFTVRRVTHGEGVERCFPMDAKTISKIEVLRRGQVRRSRLYFLRHAVGKTRIAAADPGQRDVTIPIVNKADDAQAERAEAAGANPGAGVPRG